MLSKAKFFIKTKEFNRTKRFLRVFGIILLQFTILGIFITLLFVFGIKHERNKWLIVYNNKSERFLRIKQFFLKHNKIKLIIKIVLILSVIISIIGNAIYSIFYLGRLYERKDWQNIVEQSDYITDFSTNDNDTIELKAKGVF